MSSGHSSISNNIQNTSSEDSMEHHTKQYENNTSQTNKSELYLVDSLIEHKPSVNFKPVRDTLIHSYGGLESTKHIGK